MHFDQNLQELPDKQDSYAKFVGTLEKKKIHLNTKSR